MSDLAPYATHAATSRGRRFAEPAAEGRSVFQRDRDRILHSGAFRKLQYKTQVFINHEGDYYRTRLTHSLEVAQVTRSICRTLKLDEDLGEAIALAHDLGHTCFGHSGEDALHDSMKEVGGFFHNDQTLRSVTFIEQRYAGFDGLNLTWETIEGLAKHNGPLKGRHADIKKHGDGVTETIAALDAVWPLELDGFAGLEAQVAALADDIAYTAHDLDDGLRGGYFTLDDLRELPLIGPILDEVRRNWPDIDERRQRHEMHRRLVHLMVGDVVAETRRRLDVLQPQSVEDVRAASRACVSFSEALRPDERVVRAYLFKHLYKSFKVNRVRLKAFRIVQDLYRAFIFHPDTLPPDWQQKMENAETEPQKARVVADYIAGMTDRFAIEEHRRLFDMNVQV